MLSKEEKQTLIELADSLDSKGLKIEAKIVDNVLNQNAELADIESDMDMKLMELLDDFSPEDLLKKVKEKIQSIVRKKI